MSPKKRSSSLKKTCDFCVRRKRSCDGFSRRRCSFCIATKQPVCYYRPRRRWGSQTSRHDCNPAEALVGRSFWRADGETAPAFTGGDARVSPGGCGCGDRRLLLPLKRSRFSASPATGLIGLQENEFLGDFFGCLGFLSLTSKSTVRGAMVDVMLAGSSLQQGAPSAPHLLPGHVEKDADSVREAVGESSSAIDDSAWSSALAAENGSGTLPRDPSTCALWSAIALGALVRGFPLDYVERYVELAQDSLWACYDGATLNTARAYIAMAVLRNFLGEKVKSYQCVKLANGIVDALPSEEIPRGFRELLKYAGFAWAIETDLAPVEDTNSYWKNVPPIWQLSESVMERDVCGFVLSIVVPLNQPLMDEASAGHVLAKQQQQQQQQQRQQQQQQQQLSEVAPVATPPPIENPYVREAELDRVCLENAEACAEVQKSVMPEMLRLEECIESSTTRYGLGGLLYYGELTYLKLLDKEASMEELKACIQGCVEVVVRYPGLCRYNTWLHYVHILLEFLAMFQSRHGYEATRVAYNSVRPVGTLPAAPLFEEWRMSDVCNNASCRRLTMLLQSIYTDYLEEWHDRKGPMSSS